MDFYTDLFSILRSQILVSEANPENTEKIGRELASYISTIYLYVGKRTLKSISIQEMRAI